MGKLTTRRILALAISLAAALAGCGRANVPSISVSGAAAPEVFQTQSAPANWEDFAVPKPANPPPSSDYRGIVTGSDKNVWFADRQNVSIDRVSMSGTVTVFPLPVSNELPWGLTLGPDGAVWFTTTGTHVGRITTAGAVSEFTIPCGTYDGSIHAGSDGNVWFPDCRGNVDRITSAGAITSFSVQGHQLKGMALGKDGNLWFSDITAHTIDRITAAGSITAFPYHNLGANFATVLALGPDGNVWFAECNASEYGEITTAGAVTYHASPLCLTEPNALVLGPDAAMWAAAPTSSGIPALERISAAGSVSFFNLPSGATTRASDLARGPDGNLWFTGGFSYDVSVYIRSVLSTSPKSLSLTAIGQSANVVIKESSYKGAWTVTSANTSVASVAPAPTPVPSPSTSPAPENTYAVRAVGAGSTYITVSDSTGNSVHVPVTVP